MKKQLLLTLAIVLGTGQAWVFSQKKEEKKQQKKKAEHYSAVIIGTGGAVGGRSMSIDIYIEDYTSDEEAQELAALLKSQGQDALRRALEKLKRGRISPVGRVGNDIAVIRTRPSEKGRQIYLVTAREMSWLELYRGGRSTDYNIGWIVLDVNEKGKGDGIVFLGAKLSFNEEGVLEVESYGHQYLKLANVRLWK